MTSTEPARVRIIGRLSSADGRGVVCLEDRFDTDIFDLWSALTEPDRLARWIGEVQGELSAGGEFHARFFASEWEGTCRVRECDPPNRFLITTSATGEPEGVIKADLTADGDSHTVLVIEDRGLPLDAIAAYGAGDQIHLEDLAAYLAGRPPGNTRERWEKLQPAYLKLRVDS